MIRRLINQINSLFARSMWIVAWIEDFDGIQTDVWHAMPKAEVDDMIALLQSRPEVKAYLAAPIRIGTEPHWVEGEEPQRFKLSTFGITLVGWSKS